MFPLVRFVKFAAYAEHVAINRNICKVAKLYAVPVLSLCLTLSLIITFGIGHC